MNVGKCRLRLHICPLFCFVSYWTTKNTMDKLQALRNESGGFCEVMKNKCKKYVLCVDKCFKQVYNIIKDTERRNR